MNEWFSSGATYNPLLSCHSFWGDLTKKVDGLQLNNITKSLTDQEKCILANLIKAAFCANALNENDPLRTQDYEVKITVNLDKKKYKKVLETKYGKSFITNPDTLKKAIHTFESGGYCKLYLGSRYMGKASYIELMPALAREIAGAQLSASKLTDNSVPQLVRLEGGRDPSPRQRPTYHTYEFHVREINKASQKQTVTYTERVIDGTDVNIDKLREGIREILLTELAKLSGKEEEIGKQIALYTSRINTISSYNRTLQASSLSYFRKFEKDLSEGGRFYSNFQSAIPRNVRPTILLNGQPTVEVDYKSFHIRLAHHYEGLAAACRDLYEVTDPNTGEPFQRDDVKSAVNICLNTDSTEKAIDAFCYQRGLRDKLNSILSALGKVCPHEIERLKDLKTTLNSKRELRDKLYSERLVTTILGTHSAVGDWLCKPNSNGWHKLQNIDSQIAEAVLLEAVQSGRPFLALHDSFVVQYQDESWLQDAMVRHYQRMVGTTEVPELKVIPGSSVECLTMNLQTCVSD